MKHYYLNKNELPSSIHSNININDIITNLSINEYDRELSNELKNKISKYLNINRVSSPDTRWFIDYSNYFVLPRNVIQKSNFTLLKERTYLNDFQSEVLGRGEAALKNKFSLSKAFKYFSPSLFKFAFTTSSSFKVVESFTIPSNNCCP